MTDGTYSNQGKIDLEQLYALQQKPQPYTPGERLFWTDPYISKQMLAAHLNPDNDTASRRPEIIDRSVEWIVWELGLKTGDAVIDLGCGPGLYTSRLAQKGLRVTGVDFSQGSIDYAVQYALDNDLEITYRCQDYLELEDEGKFDAALLIYGDFCPLSPDQRRKLLANVHRALKPGGTIVLDVSRHDPANPDRTAARWYASRGGFWRPGPHLVLEQNFSYPETALQLDQYIVIEENGALAAYRVWRQEYSPESISAELNAGGFEVIGIWGDLTGTPDTGSGEWIGAAARKTGHLDR